MIIETTFAVESTHPCLAGHFPGQPVVPGVVLLDLVCAAWLTRNAELRLRKIVTAKFTSPVLPEQVIAVFLSGDGDGRVTFRCNHAERLVGKGLLQFCQR